MALTQLAVALAGTGQALPQPPQFMMSVATLISQPLAGTLSQSEEPCEQLMITHAPIAHACTLLAPLQLRPQAPQFFGSAAVEISQPLIARLSQSAKPALHEAMPQLPLRHTGTPLAAAHAFMQLPQ